MHTQFTCEIESPGELRVLSCRVDEWLVRCAASAPTEMRNFEDEKQALEFELECELISQEEVTHITLHTCYLTLQTRYWILCQRPECIHLSLRVVLALASE